MAIDIKTYGWRTMTDVVSNLKPAPMFLQDMVFKQRITRPAEYIDVEMLVGGKKIVPFVTPVEGGILLEKQSREMKSIKLPRIRVKKTFTPEELYLTRGLGQGIYISNAGNVNQHKNETLARELADMRNRVDWTIEKYCAEALAGAITVSQENIAFSVNFGMPIAHKPDISGDAALKWNGTAPDIIGNIDTWNDLIVNAMGIGGTIGLCGKNVVPCLRKDDTVLELLDNRRIEVGNLSWKAGSNYLGNLNGIELYRYGTQYTTLAGVASNFVPDNVFILIAPTAKFSIEFGLIMDFDAGQIQSEFFSKEWIEKDPSALTMLVETRPLPVVWQPEAIVYATVTTS